MADEEKNKRVYLYDISEGEFIAINSRGSYKPSFLSKGYEDYYRDIRAGELYFFHNKQKGGYYEVVKIAHEAQTRNNQRIIKKIIFLMPPDKIIFNKDAKYKKAILRLLST